MAQLSQAKTAVQAGRGKRRAGLRNSLGVGRVGMPPACRPRGEKLGSISVASARSRGAQSLSLADLYDQWEHGEFS